MKHAAVALTAVFLLGSVLLAGPAPASSTNVDNTPTFSADVAPILQARCQGCHRPGQIGPMPLLDYQQTRPWAKSIAQQVEARTMPPWFAHPDSRTMKGDLNLTDAEVETILTWARAGAPEGDSSEAPAPRKFETFEGGWTLKVPELVLQPAEPFPVGKEVDDEYRCFFVDLPVAHEVWLKGTEFRPGNSSVVHHFILFGDSKGKARSLDEATPEPGWECGQMDSSLVGMDVLQMWAPGNLQPLSPEGIGRRIAAGSELVLQIHYHNVTGEDQLDHSSFGLHLAHPEETIDKEMRAQLVSAWTLDIPAGDANAEHRAQYTTPEDITVYSTGVHMHYRGKDMGLWAERPGADRETLIWVPNYDFNWQLTYEFEEPLHAPEGTLFEMISHHDNSADNPHNPAIPPVDVKWGLATSDEMSFSGITYTLDSEELGITPRLPATQE